MSRSGQDASTFVISLTPFASSGALDEGSFRLHLRRMASAGIGVYVAGSGSGEAYRLTPEERRSVLRVAAEELKGKVPVRAMGTEPRGMEEVVQFASEVNSAGLDAMQLYSLDIGHGISPTRDEMRAYLFEALENIQIPVVISSHHYAGFIYPTELLEEVVDRFENVIGINYTHPRLEAVVEIIERLGDKVEIHVGGPTQALAVLALGGTGFLTSEANLAPSLSAEVIRGYESGELDRAFHAYSRALRLFAWNQQFGSIRGVKAALGVLGLPGGYPRRPRLPIPTEQVESILTLLAELQLTVDSL